MFLQVFLFELRYWLRQPIVYIFLFVNALLFFGATYFSDNVTIGQSLGNIHVNSPYAVEQFYSYAWILGLLMVTAFINVAATRDFSYNTYQIIFSTSLKKFDFLLGRFCGAVLVAIIPFLGISIGNIVGSAVPGLEPERIGPTYLSAHLNGILVFAIPTVIFAGAFIFTVATLTRNATASFIATILLMVAYGFATGLSRDIKNEYIGILFDPFGARTFSVATKYWTVDDMNTRSMGLTGILLLNRLIWLAAAVGIFIFGYLKFSFVEKSRRVKRSKRKANIESAISVAHTPTPATTISYSTSQQFRQFRNQVRLDFLGTLKSTAFIVIILAGIINMAASMAFVTDSGYGLKSLPVTYIVIDSIRGTLYLFLIAIITFYSGVLVWKERDALVSDVYDALPYSKWIPPLSKLTSLILLTAVILAVAIITGIVAQTLWGFYDYKVGVYIRGLLVIDLLQFTFLIALALFLHTIINNRYIAYFAFITFMVLNLVIWRALNISSNMIIFSGTPSYTYSDMNGFNPYVPGLAWFNIYWFLFCGLIAMGAVFFWVRGRETSLFNRWQQAKNSFSGGYRLLTISLLVLWIGTAGFVFYNTKMENRYTTPRDREQAQADYEKNYRKYLGINQPRITDIKYKIDLYPEQRDLNVDAVMVIKNKGTAPIDSIHFTMMEGFDVTIDLPNSKLLLDDKKHLYKIYQLQPALLPGDSLTMTVKTVYDSKGFENQVRFTQIVENGSFFNNQDVVPQIGYQENGEIEDKNRRKKCGLPERNRMPALVRNCTDKCMDTYLSNNSDWVNVETIMSTSADQVAVAPGSLLKEWTEGDRHFFHYKLDHPSMNFYSFISARYEVAREKWNGIDAEVYYVKEHKYNVEKMMASIKNSMSYYTEHFGPYYQKQARIIEFPRYASFAQAFPGTMPYSESIGFIANLEDPEDIDMVYYVVAHEMGHQWWAHQVIGANMQGATVLSETMAQYSALMVMEKMYGKAQMHKFLKYEMDNYLRSRGREAIKETPLLKVENQGYIHYRKGSVVMYYLKEMIGEDSVNRALQNMIDSFAYRTAPYPTSYELVDRFERETPDSLKYLVKDLFYDITLFNNRTIDASYKTLNDGKYEVTLKVLAQKFKADSLGKETKVAINDWIEIGALAVPEKDKKTGKQLYSKLEKLTSDTSTFTFLVNEKPDKAGIDPNYYLVDRMPDDNLESVSEEQ